MGIFSNLINKVTKGAARVGYAIGVVDSLDSKKPVGVFPGSNDFKDKNRWQILAEMHENFYKTEKMRDELVNLPKDSLDTFEVSYGKIAYQPALDGFRRAKQVIDERKEKNFANYLAETLDELASGSWRNSEFYKVEGDGFVRADVFEAGMLNTLNYYAQKLVSVGGEKKHTDLIERVSKITGKDYFLASRSSR